MSSMIHKVVSPLMGTFYRSPDPDTDAFVQVGQKVNPGDVVCVIESMKIFTELRTEKAGTVKRVLVENEDAVMKNQELIEIETEA
ncbi:MAG: biotin carboxyl carrier domain-containing protein [Desulfosarcina sp.]|nr:biotin carboxyl carrier domain-containing protein [Desulfobacterales bacterium]